MLKALKFYGREMDAALAVRDMIPVGKDGLVL